MKCVLENIHACIPEYKTNIFVAFSSFWEFIMKAFNFISITAVKTLSIWRCNQKHVFFTFVSFSLPHHLQFIFKFFILIECKIATKKHLMQQRAWNCCLFEIFPFSFLLFIWLVLYDDVLLSFLLFHSQSLTLNMYWNVLSMYLLWRATKLYDDCSSYIFGTACTSFWIVQFSEKRKNAIKSVMREKSNFRKFTQSSKDKTMIDFATKKNFHCRVGSKLSFITAAKS